MPFITDYLVAHSQERPDALALSFEGQGFTWAQLERQVAVAAAALAKRLPGRQKVVGLVLPNSPQFVIIHLAVLYLEHISCPFDPTLKPLEVDALRQGLQPDLMVDEELAGQLLKDGTEPARLLRKKGDPAVTAATLLFTSGTTGKPKATLYSHANHLWNVQTLAALWRWNQDDRLLLSLPLSHWHGLIMGLTGCIYAGCELHLQRSFNVEHTLAELSSGRISLFFHVPPAYIKMANYPDAASYDLSQVRLCISGSSYLPPAIWEQFKEKFGQEILERYGSSEAGIIASNPLDERQAGSVGYLLPEVELRLLPNHELGIKSPGVFMGYYRNEEATAEKFTDDGFFKTGDLGEQEETGRIRLKGRIQERMKKFGYTVSPRDVEWALSRCPGVVDCYVLGIQRNLPDDEIIYFIEGSGDISEESLRAFCKDELPYYWRPDRILFLSEVPRTRSGKPKLKELAQQASASQ